MAELTDSPGNRGIRRFLATGAAEAVSDFSKNKPELGGWELRCHPDLVERMQEAAADLPASSLMVMGLPAFVHSNGLAFAVAAGTSLVLLRLPPNMRHDVQRAGGASEVSGDPDWVDVEPWLDLPNPRPTARLGEWMARAHTHAGTVAGGD